jgi:hypothetical protein
MNPYQPTATEEIQLVGGSAAGGTLQDGIEGNYDFSIIDVLKEAWQKTYGIKGTFFVAMIVYIVIIESIASIFPSDSQTISSLGMQLGMSSDDTVEMPQAVTFLQDIVTSIVSLPIFVGMIMIGVYRSVDMPIRISIIFDYFEYTIPIVIAAFLMGILEGIGFLLLIIPGIYLMIAYGLTYPLIVEKNLRPWKAMEASRKAITHHWFKVFFIHLIMGIILLISIIPLAIGFIWTAPMRVDQSIMSIILLISIIPLGIGLIWTVPMSFNMEGILYRIIFGVEAARIGVVAR